MSDSAILGQLTRMHAPFTPSESGTLGALLPGFVVLLPTARVDYFLCVCKAAVVPTLSGSPQWECLRVSKR
jgi:hypothetical protein